MPKKIRELIEELQRHGFVDRGGKGSYRNFIHPQGIKITLAERAAMMPSPIRKKM